MYPYTPYREREKERHASAEMPRKMGREVLCMKRLSSKERGCRNRPGLRRRRSRAVASFHLGVDLCLSRCLSIHLSLALCLSIRLVSRAVCLSMCLRSPPRALGVLVVVQEAFFLPRSLWSSCDERTRSFRKTLDSNFGFLNSPVFKGCFYIYLGISASFS